MSVITVSYTVEVYLDDTWQPITSSVLSVDVSNETSGNRDNALAFGDSSEARASVEVPVSLALSIPDNTPIRITYTVNGVSEQVFAGVVKGQGGNLLTARLECESYKTLVSTTRAYSLAFYRRPVATRTTVSSIENPATVGYRAGLINWILWMAGGRPAEQDFAYPEAVFYYSCEQAILAPDWSWLAGEDGWAEALKLVQASGGQLFIARDGVVTFKQPLSFPNGAATFTFDFAATSYTGSTGWFGDASYQVSTEQLATKILCPFTPRRALSTQEVVNDDTPRLVEPGKTITFVLEPKWPLKSLERSAASDIQLDASCFNITFLDGTPVLQAADGGYGHSFDFAAQRIEITIGNTAPWPFSVNRVILRGEPIAGGEPGSVTVGSGSIERTIGDGNIYIQTGGHALRLAEMTYAFHSVVRPLRTLTQCPPDINRYEGETVNLTCSPWGLSAVPHVIIAIRRDDSNGEYSYDLVPVDGLPRTDEFYLVGTTDYGAGAGSNLKLGY